jgi:hypothetical protein
MISVQTFYFRGEKWLQFLRMITDYNKRVDFLKYFIAVVESKNIKHRANAFDNIIVYTNG